MESKESYKQNNIQNNSAPILLDDPNSIIISGTSLNNPIDLYSVEKNNLVNEENSVDKNNLINEQIKYVSFGDNKENICRIISLLKNQKYDEALGYFEKDHNLKQNNKKNLLKFFFGNYFEIFDKENGITICEKILIHNKESFLNFAEYIYDLVKFKNDLCNLVDNKLKGDIFISLNALLNFKLNKYSSKIFLIQLMFNKPFYVRVK